MQVHPEISDSIRDFIAAQQREPEPAGAAVEAG